MKINNSIKLLVICLSIMGTVMVLISSQARAQRKPDAQTLALARRVDYQYRQLDAHLTRFVERIDQMAIPTARRARMITGREPIPSQAEAEWEEVRTDVRALEQSVTQLTMRVAMLEMRVTTLESEVRDQQSQIDSLRRRVEELERLVIVGGPKQPYSNTPGITTSIATAQPSQSGLPQSGAVQQEVGSAPFAQDDLPRSSAKPGKTPLDPNDTSPGNNTGFSYAPKKKTWLEVVGDFVKDLVGPIVSGIFRSKGLPVSF